MKRRILPVGAFDANCAVLWNDGGDACWIVDPGADAGAIAAFCGAQGLRPALVAFTHGHFDHIGGVTGLLEKWPDLPVHISPGDAAWAFTRANAWEGAYPATPRPATLVADLVEGATLAAAGLSARVLATPGHTPGGVCLRFEGEGLLLSGDTLFAGSCGRTDFPGGSREEMEASLRRLAALPPETEVVPGHGPATTIGREVATNPFLA